MKTDFICPIKIDTELRYKLFEQTIISLMENTNPDFVNRVVFVNDGSEIDFEKRIGPIIIDAESKMEIHFPKVVDRVGVGGGKNFGVNWIKEERGKFLYLFDGDVYFTKGWLTKLMNAYSQVGDIFKIIAGGVHPYLQPRAGESYLLSGDRELITSHDALSGWSWFMDYDTWDKYGELASNALGSGQSEDWEYCQRIRKDGYKVGCLKPQIIAHCGITNTEGKPIVGQVESIELAKSIAGEAMLL